jgi:recombination protein RecR
LELPQILQAVVDNFKKIPGIGEKTALRHALFLTNWGPIDLSSFGESLEKMGSLRKCLECGIFCDEDICKLCNSPSRSEIKTICVVETIADFMAIEKGGGYFGLFHVLGGTLNPLMGIGPSELNLESLVERVKTKKIENIILALNPSVEGDATCAYIKNILPHGSMVERIGFGIPIGGSLEYLDSLTITKAIENRRPL